MIYARKFARSTKNAWLSTTTTPIVNVFHGKMIQNPTIKEMESQTLPAISKLLRKMKKLLN